MTNLKKMLQNIYGADINCIWGKADAHVQAQIKAQEKIAVYGNEKYEIAIVWDVGHRVDHKGSAKTLSYAHSWDALPKPENGISCVYKTFRTENGSMYEKILIVSFEVLEEIKYDLYDFLIFSKDDVDFPENRVASHQEIANTRQRRKNTIAQYIRSRKFRGLVLVNYNNACAICGCTEKKLLEAAHIIAVKDGGSDEVENGICLCRNHHKMFDEKLIELDFTTYRIHVLSPTVADFINDAKTFAAGNHNCTHISTHHKETKVSN